MLKEFSKIFAKKPRGYAFDVKGCCFGNEWNLSNIEFEVTESVCSFGRHICESNFIWWEWSIRSGIIDPYYSYSEEDLKRDEAEVERVFLEKSIQQSKNKKTKGRL